jgi:hypothetical protein
MPPFHCWLILGLSASLAAVGAAQPDSRGPQSVAELRSRGPNELADLFAQGKVGDIPIGDLDGQVLYLADRFGKFKVNASNLVWRGKYLGADDSFANRWIGKRRWLGSNYAVGTSWLDGKPAIILEYPRGTPLFANMHDELREIAPGVFLGHILDRDTRKFRGYFAIEVPVGRTVTTRPVAEVPQRD